jgi:hypothetical protein
MDAETQNIPPGETNKEKLFNGRSLRTTKSIA